MSYQSGYGANIDNGIRRNQENRRRMKEEAHAQLALVDEIERGLRMTDGRLRPADAGQAPFLRNADSEYEPIDTSDMDDIDAAYVQLVEAALNDPFSLDEEWGETVLLAADKTVDDFNADCEQLDKIRRDMKRNDREWRERIDGYYARAAARSAVRFGFHR